MAYPISWSFNDKSCIKSQAELDRDVDDNDIKDFFFYNSKNILQQT